MKGEKLLTAADLAEVVQADLKTIHNWVEKNLAPPHFRTPGGHLRFKAGDVAAWLTRRGYTVPDELKVFLPKADGQLAKELEELGALAEAMTAVQRAGLLEVARGIVGAAKTGAAA